MENYHITLSEKMLLKARLGEDSVALRRELYYTRLKYLENNLCTDDLKKTFWINIYKAFYLIMISEQTNPSLIYKQKRIKVAKNTLSLNDIEHGILRKCKFKIGFGYITNPFYSNFIKKLAVKKVDYRIHFALFSSNSDYFPFDFYNVTDVDKQLALVTKSFIKSDTAVDNESKNVFVSKYLLYYINDFGGFNGVKRLIGKTLNKDLNAYTLKFKFGSLTSKTLDYSL